MARCLSMPPFLHRRRTITRAVFSFILPSLSNRPSIVVSDASLAVLVIEAYEQVSTCSHGGRQVRNLFAESACRAIVFPSSKRVECPFIHIITLLVLPHARRSITSHPHRNLVQTALCLTPATRSAMPRIYGRERKVPITGS